MPPYAGSPTSRPQDIAGSLRLLGYLALALSLIFLDQRLGLLRQMRQAATLLVQPLWQVAGMPAKLGEKVRSDAVTRGQLAHDNRVLRNALLISGARVARLEAAATENTRLRAMLGVAEQGGLEVQLAPILDIDLDPTRQRLMLDAGSRQGVRLGQMVMDAGGLLGQVIAVQPGTATVLLLTDPDHAVPVEVARSGVRLVAYGRGDGIALANIARTADIRVGDVVQTSGLGGRFPPGFKVGTVQSLRPDDSRAFLTGVLQPAAGLDRGREVLLLRELHTAPAPSALPAAGNAAAGNSATGAPPTTSTTAPASTEARATSVPSSTTQSPTTSAPATQVTTATAPQTRPASSAPNTPATTAPTSPNPEPAR